MAKTRGPIETLIDALKEGLNEVMGQLAPQPDRIPIPVRDDPRRRR
ncbi:hypothetical protein [Jannaschia sp. W003]|nr:hypothetical protein [Jannaschia sp. W003]UWQ22939.1 hypothetical protein K3554_07915 [Jannaschia sp. W003]